jgi:hypothetical protein
MIGQSIQNPFPVFFDENGKTLENGYIYIGESGLNPEVHPINVYWDKDFLYPAAQPIRTINGLPSRSGTPAAIYTKISDYSIIVQDKNKNLIFSALTISQVDNDFIDYLKPVTSIAALRLIDVSLIDDNQYIGLLGYYGEGDGGGGQFFWDATSTATDNNGTIIQVTGVATGRWIRLYDKIVNVKWFGAKGDDATDDVVALQAAMDMGFAYFPEGNYRISAPLYMDAEDKIKGDGRVKSWIKKTTNTVGTGSNLGKGGAQSYAVDAIIIIRHLDNVYATYTNIIGIGLEALSDSIYGIYAPQVYLNIFEDINIELHDGKIGYYTFDTFMSSFRNMNITRDNNALAGSYGIHFDSQSDVFETGTSCNFENVWCHDGFHTPFKLERLLYSTAIACGADKFTGRAFDLSKCRMSLIGCGAEDSTTATEIVYSRYSLLEIQQMTAYTVNPSNYCFDIQGGSVNINGFVNTTTAASGDALLVADNCTVTIKGASYGTDITITKPNVDATSFCEVVDNTGRRLYGADLLVSSDAIVKILSSADADLGRLTQVFDTSLYLRGEGALYLGASSSLGLYLINGATPTFRPYTDNVMKLGDATHRWTTVYATTGTIDTSDEREKQQQRDLSDKEKSVALFLKSNLKAFKWTDAVDKKGNDARWHFGVMAQTVRDAFAVEGLDAHQYGMFCYDEWEATEAVYDEKNSITEEAKPAGNRYGVRYNELLAFIISAI